MTKSKSKSQFTDGPQANQFCSAHSFLDRPERRSALKIICLEGFVFCLLFSLRWVCLVSPLPRTWTPDSTVRFTATIAAEPEHTDTQTIVRHGIWYIPLRGYAAIIPGSRVAFFGKVETRVQLGKVVRISMVDPTFEVLATPTEHQRSLTENAIIILGNWRNHWVHLLEMWLPEPMASLSAGILLGVKREMPGDFYQSLVNTGTLHIIAASGYNVSIVLAVLMGMTCRFLSRGWAIGVGLMGVLVYVMIAGGGASVVRAALMGGLTLCAFYVGRPTQAKRLLWLSAALMLLVSPLLILDIGFQLSFMATAGLFYIEPVIALCFKEVKIRFLSDYLYPTLAASLSTLPIILWHFGRVSWISPVVNMLVLPLVPLIMGVTAIVLFVGMITPGVGQLSAWLLYPALWWVVRVIQVFGR